MAELELTFFCSLSNMHVWCCVDAWHNRTSFFIELLFDLFWLRWLRSVNEEILIISREASSIHDSSLNGWGRPWPIPIYPGPATWPTRRLIFFYLKRHVLFWTSHISSTLYTLFLGGGGLEQILFRIILIHTPCVNLLRVNYVNFALASAFCAYFIFCLFVWLIRELCKIIHCR